VPVPATSTGPDEVDVLLSDGGIASLRPLRPEDAEALRDLHARVSDRTIWLRFFSVTRRPAEQYVDHLVTDRRVLALVAVRGGAVIGLTTAEPAGDGVAEVAFLVDDRESGRGLGSLLLEHLAAAARQRGIHRFTAQVLVENRAMLSVLLDAGFSLTRHATHGVVDIEMDTSATARAVAAADQRGGLAEARSLRPFLAPGAVAVVGVRRDGSGVGSAILRSIREGGFVGPVYVVRPGGGEVLGEAAFPSFAALPGRVDLAIVAVPAEVALDVVRDAASAGVGGVVVVSSGFGEMGERGRELQHELLRTVREAGIRLVGPNCLGLMAAGVRLNATFSDVVPPSGGLAMASQSGGVGIVLLETAGRSGLGVSSFVSLGNKADVSGNDLLAAWQDDPGVTAGALYLESFGNAPKFARLARRFGERKPLFTVVGGLSDGGRRAGASHTAAAASSRVGVEALLGHCGAIRCDGADDLAEAALLFAEQPLPRGRRLGILGNAGGMGVLAADLAEEHGLLVPVLSAETGAAVAARIPGTTGTGNPVDTGAAVGPDDLAAVAAAMLGSGDLDSLLVVLVHTRVSDTEGALARLAEARARHPEVPVLVVVLGGPAGERSPEGMTRFRSSDAAVRALARLVRYAEWRAVPHEDSPERDLDRSLAQQAVAVDLLDCRPGGQAWLAPDESERILDPYEVRLLGEGAVGADATVAAAARVGYPVVVKVAEPDVVHRSERGLVRVGLTSSAEVEAAVREMEVALGRPGPRMLVQPVGAGVEVAVGVVRDPVFGPLVMVAAGGVDVDVWDDRVFLLAPVSATDAARAGRALRIWPLLAGHRGRPEADVDSLERLIVSVGRLADEVPQVAELDLNPVLVAPDGCVVVDLKLRLAVATDVDRALLRAL
jgi:acyl-CoA synthetase (NDP forming)/RimJ/RimL family protein N-acetyltransferase